MAKKIADNNEQLAKTQDIAREAWSVASEANTELDHLRALLHSIGEQLGWRGDAAKLAKVGQLHAKRCAEAFASRANEIRDSLQDAEVGFA